MQAVRVHEEGRLLDEQVDDPVAKPGKVVVELKAAGLNRRDLFVRSGIFPFQLPLVPGSDGAGVRCDTGEEVVILPAARWGDREDTLAEGFEFFGGPRAGTYAELIARKTGRRPHASSAPSTSCWTPSAQRGSSRSTA